MMIEIVVKDIGAQVDIPVHVNFTPDEVELLAGEPYRKMADGQFHLRLRHDDIVTIAAMVEANRRVFTRR